MRTKLSGDSHAHRFHIPISIAAPPHVGLKSGRLDGSQTYHALAADSALADEAWRGTSVNVQELPQQPPNAALVRASYASAL